MPASALLKNFSLQLAACVTQSHGVNIMVFSVFAWAFPGLRAGRIACARWAGQCKRDYFTDGLSISLVSLLARYVEFCRSLWRALLLNMRAPGKVLPRNWEDPHRRRGEAVFPVNGELRRGPTLGVPVVSVLASAAFSWKWAAKTQAWIFSVRGTVRRLRRGPQALPGLGAGSLRLLPSQPCVGRARAQFPLRAHESWGKNRSPRSFCSCSALRCLLAISSGNC